MSKIIGLEERVAILEKKVETLLKLNIRRPDELFQEAKKIVVAAQSASAWLLQRKLSVGYARAEGLLDELESEGVIGPAVGTEPRKILLKV